MITPFQEFQAMVSALKQQENIDVFTEYQVGQVWPSWFCCSFNNLNPHKSLYILIDSYSAFMMICYVISGNFRRTKILNFLQKILLNASIFPKASAHWWLFQFNFPMQIIFTTAALIANTPCQVLFSDP